MQRKIILKKVSSMLLALIIVFSVTSGVSTVSAATKAKVSKVSVTNLNKKALYVAKGKKVSAQVNVSVTPNKKSNKTVSYKIANSKIASVTSKGVITGKKTGTTKLTVTSKINTAKKTTVNIKVTNPVKTVKLNLYSARILVGNKIALKSSVTPTKNTCKYVYWKTSNASVATVSTSGVITAKKAGTVTVTATAADGTGKKTACKVTVQNKVNVTSVSILNPKNKEYSYSLAVNLNEAKFLTKNNFAVKEKSFRNGSYRNTLKVESISTKDNKSYIILLNQRLYKGYYYAVTVSGINGANTKETFFKPTGKTCTQQFSATVGNKLDDDNGYEIDFDNMLGGYTVKIVSGKLPSGLKLENNCLTGIANAVANNQKVVFAATDELGTVSKTTVNFVIGDNTHLYAQNLSCGIEEDVYANMYDSFYIHAKGGSGSYNAQILDTYNNTFNINNNGDEAEIYVDDKSKLTARTYKIRVKFTDRNNSNLYAIATLTIVVKPTYAVTSIVNNLSEAPNIYYEDIYTRNSFSSSTTTHNAEVSYVPAGTYRVYTYDIFNKAIILNNNVKVSSSATFTYNYPKSFTVSGKILDTYGKETTLSFDVRLSNGKNYTYASTDGASYSFSRVPSGKYTLEVYSYSNWNDEATKVYSTSVTVGSANVTVNPKINFKAIDAPNTVASITGTGTTSITTTNGISYIKFTPSVSGEYTIYSNNDYDTYGYLYNSSGSKLASDDDSGDNSNFEMIVYLDAGETYYIGAKHYDGYSGYQMDIVVANYDENYEDYSD